MNALNYRLAVWPAANGTVHINSHSTLNPVDSSPVNHLAM